MSGSMDKVRAWNGIALFSYGFRPFFLGGAVFAALVMVLWIGMLEGHVTLPAAFDPASWHAHELLFGFLGAVIAGFLLTAVPNWTGRMPITGYPLILLFSLWVLGRVAITFSGSWPALAAALADLSMPVLLVAAIAQRYSAVVPKVAVNGLPVCPSVARLITARAMMPIVPAIQRCCADAGPTRIPTLSGQIKDIPMASAPRGRKA